MKKIPFEKAHFVQASLAAKELPELRNKSGMILPEIVIVGRSNVGKSSLINHLLQQKYLAKVSATPGKTQTINLFSIDDMLALVDLPGYGYAKVAKTMQEEWAKEIDLYLRKRQTLKCILLLLDIRRTPSDEDLLFLDWATHHQKPLLVIFTKADKVSKEELLINTRDSLNILHKRSNSLPITHIVYTIKTPDARRELIGKINQQLSSVE